MTEKENILARVREALRAPAAQPGHSHAPAHDLAGPPSKRAQEWLPAVGGTFEEQIALFRKNASDLKADFYLLNNAEELSRRIEQLRDAEAWAKVGSHKGELTDIAC